VDGDLNAILTIADPPDGTGIANVQVYRDGLFVYDRAFGAFPLNVGPAALYEWQILLQGDGVTYLGDSPLSDPVP
jgi:hypothetical protein